MTALFLGFLWVIAASLTALLPLRRQFLPGWCLLILAPFLLIWIGRDYGFGWLALGLFAVLSFFRRPLLHLALRALHLPQGGKDR